MESMDRPLRDILAETPEGDKGKLISFCLETMSRSIIVEGSTRSLLVVTIGSLHFLFQCGL